MPEIINLTVHTNTIVRILLLGFLGFSLSMLITPIYTNLAFKHQWWKKPREKATTGEVAKVFNKLHASKHSRHIPTMAGMIGLLALSIVTIIFNLDRGQTWLPLAAAVGAGAIGLLDDIINLKGSGQGTAGLSFRIKLLLTSLIAASLSYWFVYKFLNQ
jgi:phospho-N-acetylmuramoyl-pentapeptide-transferase